MGVGGWGISSVVSTYCASRRSHARLAEDHFLDKMLGPGSRSEHLHIILFGWENPGGKKRFNTTALVIIYSVSLNAPAGWAAPAVWRC